MPHLVQVSRAFEQLLRVLLDVRLFEDDAGILKQAGEVVVHVRKDHVRLAVREARRVGCRMFRREALSVTDWQFLRPEKQHAPGSYAMSTTGTTFGWSSIFRMRISRTEVIGSCRPPMLVSSATEMRERERHAHRRPRCGR